MPPVEARRRAARCARTCSRWIMQPGARSARRARRQGPDRVAQQRPPARARADRALGHRRGQGGDGRQCIAHAREKLDAAAGASCPTASGARCSTSTTTATIREIYKIVCTMTKKRQPARRSTSPAPARTRAASSTAPMPACRPRCCRRCTSTCAGTFPGIAACATASTSSREPGTVNNCAYPAPCAMATISAVIVTIDVGLALPVAACCSRARTTSDQAMAVWSGTSMAPIFAGTSQHGFPFAATEMSHFGGGGGARTYADGVDTAGIVFNTTPNMPNIEDQEAEYPVLYLFRRHLQDSGGPGRFRGGRSGELAYTMYDAPNDHLEGLFAGTGAEMPNAIGIAGGMPGAAIRVARVVKTDLAERLAAPAGAAGQPRGDRRPASRSCAASTCARRSRAATSGIHSWQAGGGYGDPLSARSGDASPKTWCARVVSAEAAAAKSTASCCGDGTSTLDAKATEQSRLALRKARLQCGRSRPRAAALVSAARRASLRRRASSRPRPERGRLRPLRRIGIASTGENLLPHLLEVERSAARSRPGARRRLRPRPLQAASPLLRRVRRPGRRAGRARRRAAAARCDSNSTNPRRKESFMVLIRFSDKAGGRSSACMRGMPSTT